MKLTLLTSLLAAGMLSAAEILTGGFVRPAVPAEALKQSAGGSFYHLRRSREMFVSPDASGALAVSMKNERVGQYNDHVYYSLYDMDWKLLEDGWLAVNETKVVKKAGLAQGIYRCMLDIAGNSVIFRCEAGTCCAEATEGSPLTMIYHCPKLYFSVHGPRLKMLVSGEGEPEPVAVTIWDAEGKVVFSGNSVGKEKIVVDLPVSQKQLGGVWSIKLDQVPGKGFEDMRIAILDGAEPALALAPAGLVSPIVRLVETDLGDGRAFHGVALSSLAKDVPGLKAEYTFTPTGGCTVPEQKASWKSGESAVGFVCSSAVPLTGRITATVTRDGGQPPVATRSWNVSVMPKNGALINGGHFRQIFYSERGPEAPPTAADRARGYQVFQRAEPGFVRQNTTPRVGEVCTIIKAETSPGLITAEFFAVLPLRSFDDAAVTIGDLKSADGAVIPSTALDILSARIWAQRTDWNSSTYIVAPELLEKIACQPMKAYSPQQYCVRLKVPAAARPGVYTGAIMLNGVKCLDYELTVDEFALPEYNDITFGLYADGSRWFANAYTDDEVRAEMKMFREYGMNALMVYPFTGSAITYNGDTKTWRVSFDVFRRHQRIYKEVGFPGIQVISFQALRFNLENALKAVKRGTTRDEYMAGFQACLDEIRRLAKEDGWGHFCLHTVDEPRTPKDAAEARDTLKFIRDNGFETFCTCFHGHYLRNYLADLLTNRCYCAIAYGPFRNKKTTDDIRQETLAKNANFWWYGSGCYTNGGLMQDCNVYSNRHMLGLFNWKSKATGAWTWTFLRAKDDVYNDFDHNGQGEAKDACICYPTPVGNGLIDTLQWEGCREGIYDYRYLRLWSDLVAEADKNPAKAALAAESRAKVTAATDKIAWTCMGFAVNNQQMRDIRKLLLAEIKKLK